MTSGWRDQHAAYCLSGQRAVLSSSFNPPFDDISPTGRLCNKLVLQQSISHSTRWLACNTYKCSGLTIKKDMSLLGAVTFLHGISSHTSCGRPA